MVHFILYAFLWTFALYGLFTFIETVVNYFKFNEMDRDGTYLMIITKNSEDYIEGYLRSTIFRILYGKEEFTKKIIIVDLDSNDNTREIIEKMELDYDFVKVLDWCECKDFIENNIWLEYVYAIY